MVQNEDGDDGEEELQPIRLSPDIILQNWKELNNNPLLSLSYLKQRASKGEVNSLISLHWRFFFSILPIDTTNYVITLERSRKDFTELKLKFLTSPDEMNKSKDQGVVGNNPLSLDLESPWIDWFNSLELRRVIQLDVERTFQEIDYFKLHSTQEMMCDLLLIYAKLEMGYKQGMHELLALILMAVDFDSLPSNSTSTSKRTNSEELAYTTLAREFVINDTWSIFYSLMKSAKQFYDSTPSISIPATTSKSLTNFNISSNSTFQSSTQSTANSTSSTILVQPLVATSLRIQDQLLKVIDFELWLKLDKMKVEPQLYTTKWLRLLFSREFIFNDYDFSQIYKFWSALFAEDTGFKLLEQISLVLLQRIRNQLLEIEDYSTFLMLLLKFPKPKNGDFQINVLIEQAICLRDNPTELAGVKIRTQNFELGICTSSSSSNSNSNKTIQNFSKRSQSELDDNLISIGDYGTGGSGLVVDIAKGVYERAEALGINKALFGTFNEIRKGVTTAQNQQFIRSEYSTFPSLPPPPLSPSSTSTSNKQTTLATLNKLQSDNLQMGKAMELCVNILEKELASSTSSTSTDEVKKVEGVEREKGFMASTVMSHIRDVLNGNCKTGFDVGVLKPLLLLEQSAFLNPTTNSPLKPTAGLPKFNTVTLDSALNSREPNLLLSNRNHQVQTSLSRTPQLQSRPLPPPPSSPPPLSSPSSYYPSPKVTSTPSTYNPLSVEPSTTTARISVVDSKPKPESQRINDGFPSSTRLGGNSNNNSSNSSSKGRRVSVDPLGVLGSK